MTTIVHHSLASRGTYSPDATATLAALEQRLTILLAAVKASGVWDAVMAAHSPREVVLGTLREILWGVAQYQRFTTEAGFTMLGRLPKSENKLLASLVNHKAEEAEHGEWARRDYLLLGGEPGRLEFPMSPATFAVAAVWQRLAALEDPFGYLGAEYLFECLTMEIAPQVRDALVAKGISTSQIGFIVEHAVEDVKHTNLIVHWILDVVTRYPSAATGIIRAFDYFSNVYPLPVWQEAHSRAVSFRQQAGH